MSRISGIGRENFSEGPHEMTEVFLGESFVADSENLIHEQGGCGDLLDVDIKQWVLKD